MGRKILFLLLLNVQSVEAGDSTTPNAAVVVIFESVRLGAVPVRSALAVGGWELSIVQVPVDVKSRRIVGATINGRARVGGEMVAYTSECSIHLGSELADQVLSVGTRKPGSLRVRCVSCFAAQSASLQGGYGR